MRALLLVLAVLGSPAVLAQYVGGGSIGASGGGGGGAFTGGTLESGLILDATNALCSEALSLAFEGDTDSGLQRSAANTMTVCLNAADALTLSSTAVTFPLATVVFPVDTAVTLTGGVNGINFGSNTLSIDATNVRIGIGTAAPSRTVHAQRTFAGQMMVEVENQSASGWASTATHAPSVETETTSWGTSVAGTQAGINKAGLNALLSFGASSTGLLIDQTTADPIVFATTDIPRLTLTAAGDLQGTQVTTGAPLAWRVPTAIANDTITLPTCTAAANAGSVIYVDDSNDTARAMLCVCMAGADDATYAWRDTADGTTACVDP